MPQISSQAHHVHPGDLPYATPVLRAASPSGSIDTEYGPDETSRSDIELSQDEFSKKVQAGIRLREQREQELMAEAKPLLLPRPKTAAEEKGVEYYLDARTHCSKTRCRSGDVLHSALFEQVMRSLRWHVQQLEENELIENMMLRGSQVAFEIQSSSDDIDAIMQSMMGSLPHGNPTNTTVDDSPSSITSALDREDTFDEARHRSAKGKGRAF